TAALRAGGGRLDDRRLRLPGGGLQPLRREQLETASSRNRRHLLLQHHYHRVLATMDPQPDRGQESHQSDGDGRRDLVRLLGDPRHGAGAAQGAGDRVALRRDDHLRPRRDDALPRWSGAGERDRSGASTRPLQRRGRSRLGLVGHARAGHHGVLLQRTPGQLVAARHGAHRARGWSTHVATAPPPQRQRRRSSTARSHLRDRVVAMIFGRIDATDDVQFDAWFGVLQRSEFARDGERGQGWHPDEWRARSVDESAPRVFRLYSYGPSPDRPVAVGALEVTRDDNLAFIEGNLFVEPTERRRGYGSAALAELERCARELRRPTLVIFVIEGSREIGSGPNRDFAVHHGYRVAEENVRRDLEWPRPPRELDRLWEEGTGF